MKKLLFLSGVPQSGTSELVKILNLHPMILMGMERFFYQFQNNRIQPTFFEKDRFLGLQPGDTHGNGGLLVAPDVVEARYDRAVYVGDKYTALSGRFDRMFTFFPNARHICILRNPLSVVEGVSPQAGLGSEDARQAQAHALAGWNASVGAMAGIPQQHEKNFLFVQYEELFSSTVALNALFVRLGLASVEDEKLTGYVDRFRAANAALVERRDDLRARVSENADWDSYRALCAKSHHVGVTA